MKYYFLVGYLPELQRDDRKIRVSLTELFGEQYHIPPEDWKEIEMILLGRDVFMVEKLIGGKPVTMEHSLFDIEFWKDQIKSPQEGPEFILEFLRERESMGAAPKAIDRLYAAYYDHILAESKNDLLKKYFGFEKDLRNIVVAIRARRKGVSPDEHLVGEGELVEALGRSNAEDFGLGQEYPWIDSLAATDDPPKVQDLIEQILWNYLDEQVGDDPFHFNTILAYILKLQLLEKKMALSEEQGMAKVRQLEGR